MGELFEFGGYSCKSDFVQGEKRFVITFEETELNDYHEKLLFGNTCRGILPLFILRQDEKVDIFYEISGYMRLSDYFHLDPVSIEDLLQIAKNVLFCIEECGRYLISCEQLSLQTNMVFINPLSKEVRLVFLPGFESNVSIRSGMVQLVSNGVCKGSEQEEYVSLLSKMKRMFYSGNPGIHHMVKILENLEKEINFLKWTKGKSELEYNLSNDHLQEQYTKNAAEEISEKYKLGRLTIPFNKLIETLKAHF